MIGVLNVLLYKTPLNVQVDLSVSFFRNMIKSFYTSSLLLDVLSVFGELSEEVRDLDRQHRLHF